MDLAPLFHFFEGLTQLAPGSTETTRRALGLLPPLPPHPRIIDLGCGTGRSTLELARHFRSPVTALDIHQPFLDQLATTAAAAGLGPLVVTRTGSMANLAEPPDSLDLVWSEGAFFVAGVEAMLRRLYPMVRTGGVVAFSDGVWFTDDPPAEAVALWQGYPTMADEAVTRNRIAAAGFRTVADFRLPATDWLSYFAPLPDRVAALREEARTWPALGQVLDGMLHEIAVYDRHGACYGYTFFLAVKP